MMNTKAMRRWLVDMSGCAMLALVLLWAIPAGAATPASWKDTGFSIDAQGMTLREVLQEFGRVYGVRPQISIRDNIVMSGRLKADSGSEFLDRLVQAHKFRWFVYNDTLYIVPRNDNVSMRLEVGEDAVQDAKAALTGLGLFDSRFGWGELPDEGTVVISGPRAYVNLAREVLMPDEKKGAAKGKQIMVFRLNYASATDRVITVRDRSETIPGVKTILSGLLLGPGWSDQSMGDFDPSSRKRSRRSRTERGDAREVGNTRASTLQAQRDEDEQIDRRASDKDAGASRRDQPRIEADPSLNAIMIYDNVSKRATYQALISELDIEPQQIEIEALIVDLDRSKLAEMGVEWGVRSGDTVSRINASGTDSRGVELPLPGSTLLIANAARFYARLKALEDTGEARVLAKPTVLTLDNVAAVLDLSQTAYLPLVGERVADLADVTAGTKLRVVPRLVREGGGKRVRLEVDIEDGLLGDKNERLKTTVTRSTINTQAIVDLHQTLMIGGYHTESLTKSQQKVPLLGDIPLVGGLFRSTSDSQSTRERLFLITPRLIGTTGTPAAERSRAGELARKRAQIERERDEAEQEMPMPSKPMPDKPMPVAPMDTASHGGNGASSGMTRTLSGKPKCVRPKGLPLVPTDDAYTMKG